MPEVEPIQVDKMVNGEGPTSAIEEVYMKMLAGRAGGKKGAGSSSTGGSGSGKASGAAEAAASE